MGFFSSLLRGRTFTGFASGAAASAVGGGVAGLAARRGARGAIRSVLRDRGWNQTVRELKALDGAVTIIGLPRNGTTSGRHSMNELIDVGAYNEFGSPKTNLPERSFIRSTVDEGRVRIRKMQTMAVNRMFLPGASVRVELFKIGEAVKRMIQAKIVSGRFAPLSPKTVARKGHGLPLIETEQLVRSIQHKELHTRDLLF